MTELEQLMKDIKLVLLNIEISQLDVEVQNDAQKIAKTSLTMLLDTLEGMEK